MLDITVIILTYNEELHIGRCLDNIDQFVRKIFVVDSYSIDRTTEIVEERGVEIVRHSWPGNQAEQFNWALANLPITTEWILRLDADEYITCELKQELEEKLSNLGTDVSGVVFPLIRFFCGKRLKHGIVDHVKMIRLFRLGAAFYEQRLMDEHLVLLKGEAVTFEHSFVDDNRNSIKYFIDKHNNYSSREAIVLLDAEYHFLDLPLEDSNYCMEVQKKRREKQRYAKLPLFWRPIFYFMYRYIYKLGFLDGKEGFLWDFFQGCWYRMLVDAKIFEIKNNCGFDNEKIKLYLIENYKKYF